MEGGSGQPASVRGMFEVKVRGNRDQACLHLTNDGTHMGRPSAKFIGVSPFTLILLFLLITHHSAPHKKVTVAKDGHTFTHDLMN